MPDSVERLFVVDFRHRASRDVLIGRARRNGEDTSSFFLLCWEG
jgi:hypothetical protein